jgi:hypothetical protein
MDWHGPDQTQAVHALQRTRSDSQAFNISKIRGSSLRLHSSAGPRSDNKDAAKRYPRKGVNMSRGPGMGSQAALAG